MTLRLGLATAGADGPAILSLVLEAERLGFDSTWCGESYGVDAVTRLAWLGGQTTRIRLGSSILQVPARAPALTAMTAITLDQLTGGYEAEAARIQDLYLGGKKLEAAAAVPDRLIDAVALVGPAARIRDRLEVWKAAARRGSVGTMIVSKADVAALRLVAESVLG